MRARGRFEGVGQSVLGVAAVIGMLLLPFLVLGGTVWIGQRLLPLLLGLGWWIVLVSVVLLIPNALIPGNARWAAPPLVIGSFVLGGILWLWSLVVTYWLWGWVGLLIGLVFLGLGVVPLALIAAALNGLWTLLLQLLAFGGLVFAMRTFGLARLQSAASRDPREIRL